jgi:hypothetical protein
MSRCGGSDALALKAGVDIWIASCAATAAERARVMGAGGFIYFR